MTSNTQTSSLIKEATTLLCSLQRTSRALGLKLSDVALAEGLDPEFVISHLTSISEELEQSDDTEHNTSSEHEPLKTLVIPFPSGAVQARFDSIIINAGATCEEILPAFFRHSGFLHYPRAAFLILYLFDLAHVLIPSSAMDKTLRELLRSRGDGPVLHALIPLMVEYGLNIPSTVVLPPLSPEHRHPSTLSYIPLCKQTPVTTSDDKKPSIPFIRSLLHNAIDSNGFIQLTAYVFMDRLPEGSIYLRYRDILRFIRSEGNKKKKTLPNPIHLVVQSSPNLERADYIVRQPLFPKLVTISTSCLSYSA